MRAIPQAAIDLVNQEEETHLFAYDDAFYPPKEAVPGDTIKGTLTAGTGHTGTDVTIGMAVTSEMASAWLINDLNTAAKRISDIIGMVVDELTDNQWSALLDFVFNLGANPAWTIWKRLKAKQFDQVPLEIAKFVNAGGKKLQVLVNRRNAEIALWACNEPGTSQEQVPSSITRKVDTPPTPSDPVPPTKSKGLIAGILAAISAVPSAVDQAWHVLQPYTLHSELVERAVAGMFTFAAACATISLIYIWIQKRNARN